METLFVVKPVRINHISELDMIMYNGDMDSTGSLIFCQVPCWWSGVWVQEGREGQV